MGKKKRKPPAPPKKKKKSSSSKPTRGKSKPPPPSKVKPPRRGAGGVKRQGAIRFGLPCPGANPATAPSYVPPTYTTNGGFDGSNNATITAVYIIVVQNGQPVRLQGTITNQNPGVGTTTPPFQGTWTATFPTASLPLGTPMTLIVQSMTADDNSEMIIPFTLNTPPPPPQQLTGWTMLGTASTGGTPAASITLSGITIPSNGVLAVAVLYDGSIGVGTSTDNLVYTDGSGANTVAQFTGSPLNTFGGAGAFPYAYVAIMYCNVSAGSGSLVAKSSSGTQNMMFAAVFLPGLSNSDVIGGASGASSVPDTGAQGPTSTAIEAVFAAIGMGIPPGSIAWQNGLVSCNQDVSMSVGGTVYTLSSAGLNLTATQSVDAALNASASVWGANLMSFD